MKQFLKDFFDWKKNLEAIIPGLQFGLIATGMIMVVTGWPGPLA